MNAIAAIRLSVSIASLVLVAACTSEPEATPAAQPAASAQSPAADETASEAPSRKRSAPPKVEPVEHRGVRYAVVRGARGRGLPQNGGYVEATELASGRSLWLVKVYDVVYDGDMEDDKRDVYISRLRLDSGGNRLLIQNERDERFAVELDGSKVQKLPR